MPNHFSAAKQRLINSPKRSPLFSRLEVFLLTIGMIVAFFISQLLGVYVAGKLLLPAIKSANVADVFFYGSSNGTVVSVSIMIGGVLLVALIVMLIRLKGGNWQRYLALNPFSVAVGVGMLGILLIFMIGSQALTYWLDKSPLVFVDPLYQSVSSVWLLVFAMVIVAPLYEELVFRGILWSAITEQFVASPSQELRGAIIASIVTSVIFAVIHLQYGVYEISTIVVLALIFCYARIKSSSLLLPMLLHIVNNGAAMGQYLAQTA